MIKTIISYVIEKVIVLGFIAGGATCGFNYLYSETKKAALTEVYNSLHSKNNLETFTKKMNGGKSWLDTPTKKNILRGVGNWN